MKKLSLVTAFLMALTLLPAAGFSGPSNPWIDQPNKEKQMLGKLKYGLNNGLFGWMEIFTEPYKAGKEGGVMEGVYGLGRGLVNGVMYTIGGVFDVVTFPVTDLYLSLPNGGYQCPFKKAAA